MIGSSDTPFRIKPPRLIADSATESAAGNAYAGKMRDAQTEAADITNRGSGKGFSQGANSAMYAGQRMAAGAAEGAQASAGIRAEDQQFNEGQQNAYEMEREGAFLFDKNRKLKRNQIEFERRFAQQQGRSSIAMARQRASMQLRLALMSKGLA
jgi:hypothetical protein